MGIIEIISDVDSVKRIAPLLGRREPIAGESLMSIVARACSASGFRSLPRALGSIGILGVPEFTPFTKQDRATDIAAFLRIQPEDVLSRMHPGGREVIDWWGVPARRLFIEARDRRYSPASLRLSPHHRAVWMIRALPFCPTSFEMLRSDCPSCGKVLGWRHTEGIDRCEHCQGLLTDSASETVEEAVRENALRIAGLMSFDPEERTRALLTFPRPFSTWQSTDVFEAVVELGVAQDKLAASMASGGELLLGGGQYETITMPLLMAGLDVVDRWPASLTEIVDRVATSTNASGSTALQDCLGPLTKFMRRHRAGFPLADAMATELASAFRTARVPIKSTALKRCAPPEDDGLISEKEALEQFGVYQKQLRQLDGASDTLVMRRASVSKLYDRVPLEAAVAALRSSKTPAEMANHLGIPGFALEAFDNVGLLQLQTNKDAVLMSGADRLVTEASFNDLIRSVEALPLGQTGRLEPMSRVLRHIFAPEAWATAFDTAIASGRGALMAGEGALVDRLLVDPQVIHHTLSGRTWAFPRHLGVSCIMAGRLIGQNDVLMSKAVAEGAIESWKGPKRSHMISLADLFEFDQTFAFTNDIAERMGCSPQGAAKQMRDAGLSPSRRIYRMAVWNRADVGEALGLRPKAQHSIVQTSCGDLSRTEPATRRLQNTLEHRAEGTAGPGQQPQLGGLGLNPV